MYEIVRREDFSDTTFLIEVKRPMLAKAAMPGQFVIVRSHTGGERIPLTIADFDREQGTITLVVQAVGKTTKQMREECVVGSRLKSLAGPMGNPSHIDSVGKVVCVGGGLGVAPVYPILRAYKESGAYVIGVVGFREKGLVFWKEKFAAHCDELVICTDDGSEGIKGNVTTGLKDVMARHADIGEVVAIGPPVMMKACAEATRPAGIKTIVSLNPVMVDGTGMCGGCRVTVGGETKLGCVDGPDFDGHEVDFDELVTRLRRWKEDERAALERWQNHKSDCRMLHGSK
ncbi:MAG: sulfide/dihydroorotate dehydrogenase-like FAD/NAD-binding protein [Nitrospirae bacterium]|nr:sulfide/dihydroorotate dehydrogenase-like FAD/NAD-binding protein [Nitrospirota bacterium]